MDATGPKDGSTLNFDHKKRTLIEYMRTKIEEGDWHAVSDAANDLRVLEATDGINTKVFVESGIVATREQVGGQMMTCFRTR